MTTAEGVLEPLVDLIASAVAKKLGSPRQEISSALLDIAGAAKYLNIGTKSVRRLIHAGNLPVARIGGPRGHIRIDPADLQRLVAESKDVALV